MKNKRFKNRPWMLKTRKEIDAESSTVTFSGWLEILSTFEINFV